MVKVLSSEAFSFRNIYQNAFAVNAVLWAPLREVSWSHSHLVIWEGKHAPLLLNTFSGSVLGFFSASTLSASTRCPGTHY